MLLLFEGVVVVCHVETCRLTLHRRPLRDSAEGGKAPPIRFWSVLCGRCLRGSAGQLESVGCKESPRQSTNNTTQWCCCTGLLWEVVVVVACSRCRVTSNDRTAAGRYTVANVKAEAMLPCHAAVRRDCVDIAMRRSRCSRGPPCPSIRARQRKPSPPPPRRHPGEGTNKLHRQNRDGMMREAGRQGKARQGKARQAWRPGGGRGGDVGWQQAEREARAVV